MGAPLPDEDPILLKPMRPEDVASLVALAHAQGRNLHADEYARFLALEGAHGLVLVRDGTLLGAATAIRYFDHGFLGPVIVGGEGDGLVIALLARLIEGLQRDGARIIEAEAASLEEAVLARMGFARVRRTLILEREPGAQSGPLQTTQMALHHALDIGALDAAVAGFGRKQYLLALQRDFPSGARVVERGGEVDGYVLLRRSRRGFHLGPLVTRPDSPDAARALLEDALSQAKGWPVVALVPDGGEAATLLLGHGFAEVGSLSRMRAGTTGELPTEGAATEWVVGGRLTG